MTSSRDRAQSNGRVIFVRRPCCLAWLFVIFLLGASVDRSDGGIYRSDFAMKMPREEFEARVAQLQSTIQECSRAIRANASDAGAYYRRAVASKAKAILLSDNPGYGDVIEDLEKSTRLAPDNADAQSELGDVYVLSRQPMLAIDHYDAAIELAPSAKLYRARGAAYAELGRCYAAIHDLDKVIEMEPTCAQCYFQQGQLYLKDHATEEANAKFRKAAELDPHNAVYVNVAAHPVPVYKDPVEELKNAVIGAGAVVVGAAVMGNSNPGTGATTNAQGDHRTCWKCGGRGSVSGYDWDMSGRTKVYTSRVCPVCQGSGYVR